MNRIERIRRERTQLQAATRAARLRQRLSQRLRHDPDDRRVRRLLTWMAERPAPSVALPGLPDAPEGPASDRRAWLPVEKRLPVGLLGWPPGGATAHAGGLPGGPS